MLPSQSCRWYALHVRTNHEATVALRLRDLGLKEYLPCRLPVGNHRRVRYQVTRALFPGYVFCQLDLDRSPRLCSVTGVLGIVGYGKQPVTIEDAEIDAVRRVAECHLHVDGYNRLYEGVPIELVAGPLAGVSGTVVQIDGRDRVVVALPLLQRSLAITVPREWIQQKPSAVYPNHISCVANGDVAC